ncbi:MAG: SDR family NAD(P)-dependent oxidoreductase [Planctomycetota bacterium]
MNEHVVVTGGAGFIGSNLTRALLARGSRVTVLDDLSEGEAENLAELEDHAAYRFVRADVRDEAAVRAACADADKVVHLAARKIPRYGNALATLDVNATGSRVVLEAAAEVGAKIAVASTSDVYGKNPDVPFREQSSPSVIGSPKVRRWAYAVSKMYEEQVAFALHEERGLQVTVLRYFGGYGPFQHKGWLGGPQSVFFEKAHRGEPLSIHHDAPSAGPSPTWTTWCAAHSWPQTPSAPWAWSMNIKGTREFPITSSPSSAGDRARRRAPARVPTQRLPRRQLRGRAAARPDPSLAREHPGFSAEVDVEDGLRRTWDWLLERAGSRERLDARFSWSRR